MALWARENGVVPEDLSWSDPFSRMRLEEDAPEREAFTVPELNLLFATPVFTNGGRPKPGRGEAAFWLPLVSLFAGTRLSEIAALTVHDVSRMDEVLCFSFVEDRTRGKTLKTRASARIVPVHPTLIELGWPEYVDSVQRKDGASAWLFPDVAPNVNGAQKAWSKWFNRNLRLIGITDRRKVFHSFRHTFKDALRVAHVAEDLNDALTGHSNSTVGRGYGAKDMKRRFGMERLKAAVYAVNYKGLKLPQGSSARKRARR